MVGFDMSSDGASDTSRGLVGALDRLDFKFAYEPCQIATSRLEVCWVYRCFFSQSQSWSEGDRRNAENAPSQFSASPSSVLFDPKPSSRSRHDPPPHLYPRVRSQDGAVVRLRCRDKECGADLDTVTPACSPAVYRLDIGAGWRNLAEVRSRPRSRQAPRASSRKCLLAGY